MRRERQPPLPEFALAMTLTDREVETLNRPIEDGDWGGHQTLAAEFQGRLDGQSLTATDPELRRAFKYGYGYGEGTWQQYARVVVNAAVRAGWTTPTTDDGDDKLGLAIARYLDVTTGR